MNQRQYIIGLNDAGVPAEGEPWVVSAPLQARLRVVTLVISPMVAMYFDVLGGAVNATEGPPFATTDPVSAFMFPPPYGGAFELGVVDRRQVVAVRVRNVDIVRHDFRAAFLAVEPEAVTQ